MSEDGCLTGVWDGEYSYARQLSPVRFTAVLLETGSRFSGTVHEQPPDGPHAGQIQDAMVDGARTGSMVAFTKVYEPSNPPRSPVRYEGTLSPDGCEISGVWTIKANWSGKFLMTRPGRQRSSARARRRVAVPVG
jgi:hypothetical protein